MTAAGIAKPIFSEKGNQVNATGYNVHPPKDPTTEISVLDINNLTGLITIKVIMLVATLIFSAFLLFHPLLEVIIFQVIYMQERWIMAASIILIAMLMTMTNINFSSLIIRKSVRPGNMYISQRGCHIQNISSIVCSLLMNVYGIIYKHLF